MASVSTCSTVTTCLAFFSACTGKMSSEALALAWPLSDGLFIAMADALGRKANLEKERRFILPCRGPRQAPLSLSVQQGHFPTATNSRILPGSAIEFLKEVVRVY